MKKNVNLMIMLLLAVAVMLVSPAEASSPVEYTFMWTDLGPGAGGGGPLFADGTAGGNVHVADNNGRVIAHFRPESWSEVVPGSSVDICFDVHQLKGPPIFPAHFCFSDLGITIPVSGTPVLVPNPVNGEHSLTKATPTG